MISSFHKRRYPIPGCSWHTQAATRLHQPRLRALLLLEVEVECIGRAGVSCQNFCPAADDHKREVVADAWGIRCHRTGTVRVHGIGCGVRVIWNAPTAVDRIRIGGRGASDPIEPK